jgi:hypothetical protein
LNIYIESEDYNGCRIFGSFEINKLGGNIHITFLGHGYPGKHFDHNGIYKIDKKDFIF